MRALVLIVLILISRAHAHDGHDHAEPAPSAIEKGKLLGLDQLVYLDAGSSITWAGQKLKRKISESNQIVYQYSGELKELPVANFATDKYLNLKTADAEILKAFSFDHAGESHDQIEVIAPDFSNEIVILKNKELELRWKTDATSDMVK